MHFGSPFEIVDALREMSSSPRGLSLSSRRFGDLLCPTRMLRGIPAKRLPEHFADSAILLFCEPFNFAGELLGKANGEDSSQGRHRLHYIEL